jgi:hypothetical protein
MQRLNQNKYLWQQDLDHTCNGRGKCGREREIEREREREKKRERERERERKRERERGERRRLQMVVQLANGLIFYFFAPFNMMLLPPRPKATVKLAANNPVSRALIQPTKSQWVYLIFL